MELGKKIKQLRKFSGMTQEQLAEKLNISRQALSKWENGTSMPDVESVVRISMLFQISLEELLWIPRAPNISSFTLMASGQSCPHTNLEREHSPLFFYL